MNKMWVVTWTNHVVGQISSDSIKCFEEHDTALAFAKLILFFCPEDSSPVILFRRFSNLNLLTK